MKIMKCDARAFARCPYKKQCSDSPEHTSFYEGTECDYFNQQVIHAPLTNADRIRAMSDEELAEFISRIEIGDFGQQVYGKTFCDMCKGQYECDDCRLWWLQQPAEEGNNGH